MIIYFRSRTWGIIHEKIEIIIESLRVKNKTWISKTKTLTFYVQQREGIKCSISRDMHSVWFGQWETIGSKTSNH